MQGLGTEFGILNGIIIIIVVIDKYVYPFFKRRFGKKSVVETTLGNPNSVTLGKVAQALKDHEKNDDERTNEIKDLIRELQRFHTNHEARLSVLESHAALPR